MPHQCVRCGVMFEDGSKEILSGCPCGAKLFLYISKNKLKVAKEFTENLSEDDKKQMEQDALELAGVKLDSDSPVVLDLESIRMLKPGKYELDLVHLFREDPLVFKLEEGKYIIDLPQTFKKK